MSAQNPFPAAATSDGYQVISSTCSETDMVRLVSGNLVKRVDVVQIPTISLPLRFQLTYNSQAPLDDTGVGVKWQHTYAMRLLITGTSVTLVDTSGRYYEFVPSGLLWVLSSNSYYMPGTLSQVGSNWQIAYPSGVIHTFDGTTGNWTAATDANSNTTSLSYSGSELSSVTEPTGRTLTFGWSGGHIASVTDPNGNVTYLYYDDPGNLTSVVGPEGCTLQYSYQADSFLVARVDGNGNRYRYYFNADQQLVRVADAELVTNGLTYLYDTVDEYMADDPVTLATLSRTTLIDARMNVWEYRFGPDGMLWRSIVPVREGATYWRRYYRDANQKLLFSTCGFPYPAAFEDEDFRVLAGPRDNPNNVFIRNAYDGSLARPTSQGDGTGNVSQTTYNSARKMTTWYPGRANTAIQGNWVSQFASDGYLLCGFESSSSDLSSLPSYVSSVSQGTAVTSHISLSDCQMDPRALVSPASLRREAGFWSATGSFTITINLTETKAFNVAIYTCSVDLAYGVVVAGAPFQYNEQFGRDVTFTVTDAVGTQSYRVTNNASGWWVQFPVQGSDGTPVTIEVSPSGDATDTLISALAFDPYDSHQSSYGYDANQNLTSTTDGLGNTTTLDHNSDGTVSQIIDALSNTSLLTYGDTNKNLTEVEDPYSKTTLSSFDANSNVLTRTDANGNTWTFTWDGKNRLLTVTDPLTHVVLTNVYDAAGNVISTTDANGGVTSMYYTATNRLMKVMDPLGHAVLMTWDQGGNLVSTVDANGNATVTTYDPSNRVVQMTRADGSILALALDTMGRVVAVTSPNGNQSDVSSINLTGAANLLVNPSVDVIDPVISTQAQNWDGTIDTGVGHDGPHSLTVTPTSISHPLVSQQYPGVQAGVRALASLWARPDGSSNPSSVQAAVSLYQIDGTTAATESPSLSLPTSSTAWQQMPLFRVDVPGDGQYWNFPALTFEGIGSATSGTPQIWMTDFALYSLSVSTAFDNARRPTRVLSPDGTIRRRLYDRYGRLSQVVDGRGNMTMLGYDSLGRVVTVTDPLGDVIVRALDAMGNLASLTDPNSNETLFTFDKLSRPTLITYPDSSTEQFSWDYVRNLTGYVNARLQSFTMVYDIANRLLTKTYNTDSTTVTFTPDPVGNVLEVVERNGDTVVNAFDANNRRVATSRTPAMGSPNPGWIQASAFDGNGNRVEFDNEAGTGATYGTSTYGSPSEYGPRSIYWTVPDGGYDALNRLVAWKDRAGNETDITRDIEGNPVSIAFPNGVSTAVSYDVLQRCVASTTTYSATPVLSLLYSFDADSNRIGTATGADTWDYGMDAASHLVFEELNRFVERSSDRFQHGTVADIDTTGDQLTLPALSDAFTGTLFNADCWRMAYSYLFPQRSTGLQMQQNDGLLMAAPRGYTNLQSYFDNGVVNDPQVSGYGPTGASWTAGVEHQIQLTGDFDVQVSFTDFQGYATDQDVHAGLQVADVPFEVSGTGSSSLLAIWAQLDAYFSRSYVSGSVSTASTSYTHPDGGLRITRSGSTLETKYYNVSTSTWSTLQTVTDFTTADLYVSLFIFLWAFEETNAIGNIRFYDFQSNTSNNTYGGSGLYTSAIYDAGRSVTWDTITWDATTPGTSTVQFQVAVSSSPTGPFTYVGPDGTSGTYFTTSGTSLPSLTGRYASYQATLNGDRTVTPSITRVDLLFEGANTSTAYAYTFDPAGNMTGKVTEVAGSDAITETRTVNNLNQITANTVVQGMTTTDWTYGFDDDGNMTSKVNVTTSDAWSFEYNEDRQLVLVTLPDSTTIAMTYDSAGRLLTRQLSTDMNPTQLIWDGMDVCQEIDPSGNVTRYFVVNGVLFSFERGGVVYQVHSDSLGSIRKVTDDSGTVVATFDTTSWGEPLASTSDSIPDGGLAYRWIGTLGVRYDLDSGLYYMRQRWYDPGLGRFLSRDPLAAASAYYYATNNPLKFVDPAGLDPDPFSEPLNAPPGYPYSGYDPTVFGPGASGNTPNPDGGTNTASSTFWTAAAKTASYSSNQPPPGHLTNEFCKAKVECHTSFDDCMKKCTTSIGSWKFSAVATATTVGIRVAGAEVVGASAGAVGAGIGVAAIGGCAVSCGSDHCSHDYYGAFGNEPPDYGSIKGPTPTP